MERSSYKNALLYPELYLCRIPFIAPVPTAISRTRNVYTYQPTAVIGSNADCIFAWQFIPEALCEGNSTGPEHHYPFSFDVLSASAESGS